MKLTIKFIDPGTHRENITGADWTFDKTKPLDQQHIVIKVTKMSDQKKAFALAFHEAIEAVLCYFDGVTQEQVDEFDFNFSKTHENDIEAGDDPSSPYERQHSVATAIERTLTAYWNIKWKEYDDEVAKLQ